MSASQAILAAQATDVRALPANVEAEAAFLGAVLIDNRIMEEMTVPLRPDHFFAAVHGRVFERILALIDRKAVVTPVTLKPYFESDEGLRELGGTAYLARLTGDGQGLLAPRELAQQIYDLALLRELISVGRNLVEGAMDTSETVEPLKQVEQAEAALFSVAEGAQTGNEAQTFGQATRASLEMIEKALLSGGHISGTTTGLTSVNEKIGGLHDSDLIILAGRPGMGKTSLVTNIAFNCADRLRDDLSRGISAKESVGAAVAFFSLEMSADQLATRILAEQSGISSESLRMGRISREDFQQLSFASQRLAELPLFIDDTPGLSIGAAHACAPPQAASRHRAHRGRLPPAAFGHGAVGQPRQRNFRNFARAQDPGQGTLGSGDRAFAAFACGRTARRQAPDALRPSRSGSIEQDADMVWFVFREDYYVASREPKRPIESDDSKVHEAHAAWAAEMERVFGLAELIVAKQRHGSTGKVRLRFEARITRFSDLAPDQMLHDMDD
jgi:replicative DNA helicase